jgi:hypothetical protein
MKNKLRLLVLYILCITLAIGCKKDDPKPEVQEVDGSVASFENMKIHILSHSCVSCHNAASTGNSEHQLNLEGSGVYTSLINAVPKNDAAADAGLKLIIPNSADSSFFFTKCDWSNASLHFGNSMPLGADLLDANEILFIRQWINAGAPQTGVVADYTLLHSH